MTSWIRILHSVRFYLQLTLVLNVSVALSYYFVTGKTAFPERIFMNLLLPVGGILVLTYLLPLFGGLYGFLSKFLKKTLVVSYGGAHRVAPQAKSASVALGTEIVGNIKEYSLRWAFGLSLLTTLVLSWFAYEEKDADLIHYSILGVVLTVSIFITERNRWKQFRESLAKYPKAVWLVLSVAEFALAYYHRDWENRMAILTISAISAFIPAVSLTIGWPRVYKLLLDALTKKKGGEVQLLTTGFLLATIGLVLWFFTKASKRNFWVEDEIMSYTLLGSGISFGAIMIIGTLAMVIFLYKKFVNQK